MVIRTPPEELARLRAEIAERKENEQAQREEQKQRAAEQRRAAQEESRRVPSDWHDPITDSFHGISRSNRHLAWIPVLSISGKQMHFGHFKHRKVAACAHDAALFLLRPLVSGDATPNLPAFYASLTNEAASTHCPLAAKYAAGIGVDYLTQLPDFRARLDADLKKRIDARTLSQLGKVREAVANYESVARNLRLGLLQHAERIRFSLTPERAALFVAAENELSKAESALRRLADDFPTA